MNSAQEQKGWHFETEEFTLEAIQRDERVDVYVYWNETTEEYTWFINWEGVRRYLSILQGEYNPNV